MAKYLVSFPDSGDNEVFDSLEEAKNLIQEFLDNDTLGEDELDSVKVYKTDKVYDVVSNGLELEEGEF